MTTELSREIRTAVALRSDQQEFDDKQVAALRQIGVSGATRADLAVFFHQCKRTGLDPFARQIYMIKRMVWNGDTRQMEPRQTIQTGIDGFRLIARRAVDRAHESLEYEDTLYCGPDGHWTDVWLSEEPPAAAKQVILRNGKRFSAVALFREYKATRKITGKNGKPDEIVLTGQWADKPAIMIGKCAEALVLRKAFPQDLSGLYTDDEMESGGDSVQAIPPARNEVVDAEPIDAEPVEEEGEQPAAEHAIPATDVDWKARIEAAESIEQLNATWQEMRQAGVKGAALTRAFSKRGRELAPQQDEGAGE